jgi:hypothetical protein
MSRPALPLSVSYRVPPGESTFGPIPTVARRTRGRSHRNSRRVPLLSFSGGCPPGVHRFGPARPIAGHPFLDLKALPARRTRSRPRDNDRRAYHQPVALVESPGGTVPGPPATSAGRGLIRSRRSSCPAAGLPPGKRGGHPPKRPRDESHPHPPVPDPGGIPIRSRGTVRPAITLSASPGRAPGGDWLRSRIIPRPALDLPAPGSIPPGAWRFGHTSAAARRGRRRGRFEGRSHQTLRPAGPPPGKKG